ncbi:MAG: hypothetical protein HY892_01750 [Deltaproteobacteria bacterium]|nr:hypothetical protein [Deltaproteobacteria bacterium]
MPKAAVTDGQLNLFSRVSLNPIPELKRMMRLAIKESGCTRDEIVDRMGDLVEAEGLGREITFDAFSSWLKNEDNRHIPIELLTIFCKATGSLLPLQAFIAPLEATVVREKDLAALELGQAILMKRRASQKERMAMLKLEMES